MSPMETTTKEERKKQILFRELERSTIDFKREVLERGLDRTSGHAGNYTEVYIELQRQLKNLYGKKVLEVGAGPAYFLYYLKQRGTDVYGVDIFDNPAAKEKGIEYAVHDFSQKPATIKELFPTADFDKFDAIISRAVLETPVLSNQQIEAILRNIRALSPLSIHEQLPGTSHLDSIDFEKFGYEVQKKATTFPFENELYVLKRKVIAPKTPTTP